MTNQHAMSHDFPAFYDMQPGHSLLMELQSEDMDYTPPHTDSPRHEDPFVGWDDQPRITPNVFSTIFDFNLAFAGFQKDLQEWHASVSHEVGAIFVGQLIELVEADVPTLAAPATVSFSSFSSRGSSASNSPATPSTQLFDEYPMTDTPATTPGAGSEDDHTPTATLVATGSHSQPVDYPMSHALPIVIPVAGSAGISVLFRKDIAARVDGHPGWLGIADNVQQRCLLARPPGTSCSAEDYGSLPQNKNAWERHIKDEHGSSLQCTWPSTCSKEKCCEPNCAHPKIACTKHFDNLVDFGRHISERHFGQEKVSCRLCRNDPPRNDRVRTYTLTRSDGERLKKHEVDCLAKHSTASM